VELPEFLPGGLRHGACKPSQRSPRR
jgi:hypothetical protein